jgi:hypothetical protein
LTRQHRVERLIFQHLKEVESSVAHKGPDVGSIGPLEPVHHLGCDPPPSIPTYTRIDPRPSCVDRRSQHLAVAGCESSKASRGACVRIELNRQFRIYDARPRVQHDRPLRKVAVPHGGQTTYHFHTVDGTRRDSAKVDTTTGG